MYFYVKVDDLIVQADDYETQAFASGTKSSAAAAYSSAWETAAEDSIAKALAFVIRAGASGAYSSDFA